MTRTPRVANMHVYSTPMTPPPTTISVFGISSIGRIWSLSMMVRPFNGTSVETAGLVPTPMMMNGASIRFYLGNSPPRGGSDPEKVAVPISISILLRESCACVTSISVLITCWTRNDRSAIVIFSFTR